MIRIRVTNPRFEVQDLTLDEMNVIHTLLSKQNAMPDQQFRCLELADKFAEALRPFGSISPSGGNTTYDIKVNQEYNTFSIHRK